MSLLGELRRRNVLRVAAAYVALSWLIIQVNETLFPMFGLSDAAARSIVLLLAIGFIPTLIFAWAFELTPEGLKRDREVDRDSPVSRQMAKRLDRIIIVFLVLALGYFAVDKFVLAPQREAAVAEEAREEGRTEALIESFGDKSIAVLPFTDMSPERDQAWFSDGISEELLNLLAKLNDLRVVSRSSSFALRDEGLSTPELAQRLNVTYVLEGSVRKAGNMIRITVQLIEARTDTHIWSETYDRELVDVFAIQDQISAQVVKELEVRILGPVEQALPTSAEAYELYLQGLGRLARRGPDDIGRAMELFKQVIAMDPEYAPAHASLAMALVWSDLEHRERNPRVEVAVDRTLALDPNNSDALAALGRIQFEQGYTAQAREAYERAIDHNPNNAMAYRWLGQSYSDADPVRYLALAREAFMLVPLDPTINFHISSALLLLGRHKEARDAARELVVRGRREAGYSLLARSRFISGSLDKALLTNFLIFRATGMRFEISRLLLSLNEAELAQDWLKDSAPNDKGSDFAKAQLLRQLGENERALELFADSVERIGLPLGAIDLGVAHILFDGDFEIARDAFEEGLASPGQELLQFESDQWPLFLHYALSLQRTGAEERATQLISKIKQLVTSQLSEGVVVGPFENHLQTALARLHAMSGETRQAIIALRRALDDGYLCAYCLRTHPHFDSLRAAPGFVAVLAEYDAKITIQRQRLADAGMLLTPEEVLALEEFTFDPFDAR